MQSLLLKIRQVSFTGGARRQLADLPPALHDTLYEELREQFTGAVLTEGIHVQTLIVDGSVVRANLFVDADGSLWIDAIGVA